MTQITHDNLRTNAKNTLVLFRNNLRSSRRQHFSKHVYLKNYYFFTASLVYSMRDFLEVLFLCYLGTQLNRKLIDESELGSELPQHVYWGGVPNGLERRHSRTHSRSGRLLLQPLPDPRQGQGHTFHLHVHWPVWTGQVWSGQPHQVGHQD